MSAPARPRHRAHRFETLDEAFDRVREQARIEATLIAERRTMVEAADIIDGYRSLYCGHECYDVLDEIHEAFLEAARAKSEQNSTVRRTCDGFSVAQPISKTA